MRADVGRVNGRYFAETLSFGLDAAIALDTMDRRQKSGRAGTMLYLESAVDQLFHHLQVFSFKMDVLGAEPGCAPHPEWDDAYLVAVQVGPPTVATSASHPRRASTTGCSTSAGPRRSFRPCGRWRSFCAPGAASTREATTSISGGVSLVLDFEEEPPVQMDGEPLFGTHFLIDCVPDAPYGHCGPAVGQ